MIFRFPFDSDLERSLQERVAKRLAMEGAEQTTASHGLFFSLLQRQFRGGKTPLPYLTWMARSTFIPLRNWTRRLGKK